MEFAEVTEAVHCFYAQARAACYAIAIARI